MPRPNKIWFRKDIGWWMVTLGGKKHRLAQGKQNKKLAEQKFYELKAIAPQPLDAPLVRIADVIDAFLTWAKTHRSSETNRNYIRYGQSFSEHSGFLRAADLKPIHVTRWVDEHGWKGTTERNARRSIYRAFSWACEEGILNRHPLQGMKCPRAATRQRIMSDAEYRALLRNSDYDFKVLLFALHETGCRPKEARTLTWEQVREDKWILIEHKTAHQIGRPRIVYLNGPMRRLMHVLRPRSTSSFVFLNGRGEPWTANAVRLRVQRLKKKLNLPEDLCAYLLRHSFGTNAIIRGG